MSATISEIHGAGQVKTEWHIKNWNRDFKLLKDYANCDVTVDRLGYSTPVKMRFSFQPYNEHDGNHRIINTWLSLRAHIYFGSGHESMLISVDVNTEDKSTKEVRDVRFPVDTDSTINIAPKFIHLTHNNYDGHYGAVTTEDIPKANQLHFKIIVNIFNFNGKLEMVDMEEGAFGVDPSAAEASFTRDMKTMYGAAENYSDLKLETKDNMTLTVHRFILAARSPVFRKLIDDHVNKEGLSGTIQVSSGNAKPLLVVLHWMYTGEPHEIVGKVMEEVVEICTEFKIPALLEILDKKLIKICTIQNMFVLFEVAQQNGMRIGMEAVSNFIKENIGSVFLRQ